MRIKDMIIAFSFLLVLSLLSGCCSSSPKYNYYLFSKKGEDALLAKKYNKAKNYYSTIYSNEKKNKIINTERTTWAFYRLGVIAELSGNLKMAKGYYWGDKIEDGFYNDQKFTKWFAQVGWKHIDEKNTSRSLEEILELEASDPPEKEEVKERKKEIIVSKNKERKINRDSNINKNGIITKTFNRSRTPAPYDSPEPMRILY